MRGQTRKGLGRRTLLALIAVVFFAPWAVAEDTIATLRGAELASEPQPARMADVVNDDKKVARNYPEQPPTIPHQIRDYQVHLNTNKCLSCHGMKAVEESQAPMVSVTHFMDREGQMRAAVSPRRYFCTQCHVTQSDAKPLVSNTFVDVETLLSEKRGGTQ